MTLSVIVPAYNERRTIAAALADILEAQFPTDREVVLVDDGSTDGTSEWLNENITDCVKRYSAGGVNEAGNLVLTECSPDRPGVSFRLVHHPHNRGKGAALRSGFAAATGDVLVIYDADREYDPADWTRMYDLIARRGVADAVIGSRFHGAPHRSLHFHHYLGNRLASTLFNIFYNQTLSDIEVCSKMFTREVLNSLALSCDDFGVEVQICAQLSRGARWRIYEVEVSYFGRSYSEGKKITWHDGVKALWYLLRFRFERLPNTSGRR